MSDIERLEERLKAVERTVVDGDFDLGELTGLESVTEDIERLESRFETLEERVASLEATTQSVDGYVSSLEAVNESVEQQAGSAIAAVDRLEERIDRLEAEGIRHGQPAREHSSTDGTRDESTDGDGDQTDLFEDEPGIETAPVDPPTEQLQDENRDDRGSKGPESKPSGSDSEASATADETVNTMESQSSAEEPTVAADTPPAESTHESDDTQSDRDEMDSSQVSPPSSSLDTDQQTGQPIHTGVRQSETNDQSNSKNADVTSPSDYEFDPSSNTPTGGSHTSERSVSSAAPSGREHGRTDSPQGTPHGKPSPQQPSYSSDIVGKTYSQTVEELQNEDEDSGDNGTSMLS